MLFYLVLLIIARKVRLLACQSVDLQKYAFVLEISYFMLIPDTISGDSLRIL